MALSVPAAAYSPFSAAGARAVLPYTVRDAVGARVAAMGASSHLADSTLLAVVLAMRTRSGSGDEAGYLQCLPQQLDVPALWPAPLRQLLLRGSSCERSCDSQERLSASLHATLEEALREAGAPFHVGLADFKWAQSILLSRAHSGDGNPVALVPFGDLLNHGGRESSAAVRWGEGEGEAGGPGAFEVVATRAMPEGHPLLIDYGTDRSHRLLRLYGFVPSGASCAGDEVHLPLLPTAAEMRDAPPEARAALERHVDALAACGMTGSATTLEVDASGETVLWRGAPLASALAPPAGAPGSEAAAAQGAGHVLRLAISAQLKRQEEGMAGCDAVREAGGDAAGDIAARQRARLAARLHDRERRVLQMAAQALADGDLLRRGS